VYKLDLSMNKARDELTQIAQDLSEHVECDLESSLHARQNQLIVQLHYLEMQRRFFQNKPMIYPSEALRNTTEELLQ